MNLVKREPAAAVPTRGAEPQLPLKSICLLHNCPMEKEGKPCPMMVIAKPGEPVTCPVCGTHIVPEQGADEQKTILYWTDPMIPGYRAEGPGKSPMGMDLVPVYAEEAGPGAVTGSPTAGYAAVLVTPQKQQLIGVRTAAVEPRPMRKTIRTVGRIAYDPELYQAQQEYLQVRKAWEQAQGGSIPEVKDQAQRLLESSRMRLRLLGLGPELIAEVEAMEGPDASLLAADPVGRVWLYASIYEFELPLVKVGQKLVVEVPSALGKTFEATVRSIDPVLDATSRSVQVRAVLTDREGLLRPGMFVNVALQVDLGEVLAIPVEAVFNTGERHVAFVDKGQGLFEPRDVVIGAKADDYYELKKGVARGERVVTSGNFLIDSESRLKAALDGMLQSSSNAASSVEVEQPTSPGGHHHGH
jgi:Cu(I)/Ag(I) efflux system membrane fusion protein/cobalt-zinc-cadmium efflux system membrane fusion protein